MKDKCPVVGIDIAKESCYFAVLGPNSKIYVNPTKVMNDEDGWDEMLKCFKKVEEAFNERPKILLESTGHISENFLHFLIRNDYKVFLINPLQSHSIKSSGIRKTKTDKLDCLDIARLYYIIDLREYIMPDRYVQNLKILTRTQFHISEQKTLIMNQLTAALDQALPHFTDVFTDVAKKTPIALLLSYNSPDKLLNAHKEDVVKLIKTTSRMSNTYATEKYEALMACAKSAKKIGVGVDALYEIITIYTQNLKHIQEQILKLDKSIKDLTQQMRSVQLLKSIPGIGEKIAPVIAAEIGDIGRFKNAKQLVAYCGVDPSVRQSGNFLGNKNKFTKRGSVYIRKALFMAAMISVKHKGGNYTNKVLYEYYERKTQSKVKKQALGAVMNKLIHIIFSILKNDHEFVAITPEQQVRMYQNKLMISA